MACLRLFIVVSKSYIEIFTVIIIICVYIEKLRFTT